MPNTSMNTYKHSSTSNIISNKRKLLSRLVFILCKKTSEKSGKKTVFIKAFYLTLCIFFLRFLHNFVLCIAANISNVCEIFFVAFLYFSIHVRCFFHFAKLPVTIVVWFVSKTWFFSLFLDVVVEPSCNYTTNTLLLESIHFFFFFFGFMCVCELALLQFLLVHREYFCIILCHAEIFSLFVPFVRFLKVSNTYFGCFLRFTILMLSRSIRF